MADKCHEYSMSSDFGVSKDIRDLYDPPIVHICPPKALGLGQDDKMRYFITCHGGLNDSPLINLKNIRKCDFHLANNADYKTYD